MTTQKYLPLSAGHALINEEGQAWKDAHRAQVEKILSVFFQVLPSNYVSQTMGPSYTLQYQAAAEQIASIQLAAQEAFYDSDFDFTRPEFLFQILGTLIFPDLDRGIPQLDGDVTYRTFLKGMVALLLQGPTKKTVKEGIELITDASVEVIEKSIAARSTKNSAWGFDDQFEYEINLIVNGGTDFPTNPFVTEKNAALVLRALSSAHTLYVYRHVFKETMSDIFTDTVSIEHDLYYYEDMRFYPLGAKELSGSVGETLTDRSLFSDPSRDFGSICIGATLSIDTGPNVGTYRVDGILTFPVGTDTTARTYTTSPTGLTGTATVSGSIITDTTQDFATTVEGEILTFTAGPNIGSYRLKTLQGANGGPVGVASGPASAVSVAASLLRIYNRMPSVTTGQTYRVSVDHMGIQKPHTVVTEDASAFFYL